VVDRVEHIIPTIAKALPRRHPGEEDQVEAEVSVKF